MSCRQEKLESGPTRSLWVVSSPLLPASFSATNQPCDWGACGVFARRQCTFIRTSNAFGDDYCHSCWLQNTIHCFVLVASRRSLVSQQQEGVPRDRKATEACTAAFLNQKSVERPHMRCHFVTGSNLASSTRGSESFLRLFFRRVWCLVCAHASGACRLDIMRTLHHGGRHATPWCVHRTPLLAPDEIGGKSTKFTGWIQRRRVFARLVDWVNGL